MLAVSLLLNVFLGSVLVGRMQSRPPQPAPEQKSDRIIERMASTLPESDGKILRSVSQSRQTSFAGLTAEVEKARDEVRRILRAEPFDQAALQAAFAEVRQRRQAVHEAIHAVLIEAAPQLSPEGRQKLAEWRKEGR
jgi:uncharacterized membrane protein